MKKGKIQEIQSNQYRFPYHYIPDIDLSELSYLESRRWNFAKSYATALALVARWMKKQEPISARHIDIGCGDGGFLHHLSKQSVAEEYVGIDYDESAIRWANLFNPDIDFYCRNILRDDESHFPPKGKFDSASLIEVIEHIPPDELAHFMTAVSSFLNESGKLIVTVPHKNKPLIDKHFQHFTFESLETSLRPLFRLEEIVGFETVPLPERLFRRLLQNRHFFCEIPVVNSWFLRRQLSAVSISESECGRIFAIFSLV